MIRLPSFNDFSPHIIGDLRIPLGIVAESGHDKARMYQQFADSFFSGKLNKRSTTNIPATLTSLDLAVRAETGGLLILTNLGREILGAPNVLSASQRLARYLFEERHADVVVEAVRNLASRGAAGSFKQNLKSELEQLGIKKLSTATTDHTTLVNWLIDADLIHTVSGVKWPNDSKLKDLVGISSDEYEALQCLSEGQRLFLRHVRQQAELEPEGIPTKTLISLSLNGARHLFREDQMRKEVIGPLEEDAWISTTGLSRGRGAKSGFVHPTDKLLNIPMDYYLREWDSFVPGDLRRHLSTPVSEIQAMLTDADSTYRRGLGLELLSLRMIIDLGLEPRGFRARSKDTAHAEVDLLAEGSHLMFSRWTIQCKNLRTGTAVGLSDVAKEVGIAIHQRAHVVVLVTTTRFSADALKYAKEMSHTTHLQFLFIEGTLVRNYLASGPAKLLAHVTANAEAVMRRKQPQLRSR